MAGTVGSPAVAIALREALAARRAAGEDFEDAWPAALADVLADIPARRRELWEYAFDGTRDAWEAGYQREAVGLALFVA